MKKSLLNYSLIAALACGLSMGFASCSDDDKENSNGNGDAADTEVMNAEQTDEAVRAWSWISLLTDEAEQATDWQNKQYTATIGEESSNDQLARLIYVKDLENARASFASIAGCKPEELLGTKTVQAGDYGTMKWNVSPQGTQNIATVDVQINLIPKLEKIIYCTPDQAEDNAAEITGNCYYRLGDVIEDAEGYYWVCVSPSFQGKTAKDSYWMNIFNADPENGKGVNTGKTPGIPQKNIYSKYNKKYNGNTILLPTGLRMDRKQNYNLANLMWALLNPDKYMELAEKEGEGLCGTETKYYGSRYLTHVASKWYTQEIWEKLFNRSYQLMRMTNEFNFFYYGYHWKIGSTAGVWVYNSNGYKTQYDGSLDDDDTLYEMKKKGFGFDIRRYISDPNQDNTCAKTDEDGTAPSKQFFGGLDEIYRESYWVVRVATGKQLDSKYDPYKPLDESKYFNVYNFNGTHNDDVGANEAVVEDKDL